MPNLQTGKLLFYDIEAFKHYWCVVVVDEELGTRHVFEDVESLRGYYKRNRKRTWVGYNSRQYDAPMIRFIMLGMNPYQCSQDLIVTGKKWFQFGFNVTEMYKRIPLRNYDCALLNKGLKKLEGYRGSDIEESSIPWDYDLPLTREQKDNIVGYCTHDTLECRKVFYDTIEDYEAHESLVETFSLADEYFNKTKAQLSALILGAKQRSWFDEWEYTIVDTLRIEKYTHVLNWFLDPENHNYKNDLKTDIAGVPHTFAWGGIHGAKPKYYGKGRFVNMDVRSYYPSLMIEYYFLSRNVLDPEKFTQIYVDRIEFKAVKDPRQQPYKIVLNGTYGAMKDKYNALYDPRQANNVCVNGQLLLVDLMERLEDHCEIIQSNTDGVLVKLHNGTDEEYNNIVDIGNLWSERTRMVLEFEEVSIVAQKDVNNYLTIDKKGKVKSKGAWAKTWLKEAKIDGEKVLVPDYTDYDCVILRKALQAYFQNGTPVADTINACDELRDFQKIVMVSRKYDYAIHGKPEELKWKEGKTWKKKLQTNDTCTPLKERHLRMFASSNESDGGVFKRHAITKGISKVNDSPKHAFFVNDNIETAKVSDYPLDKSFYIAMAESRVKKFVTGVAV
jgi:hypothetical protein